MTKKYKVKNTNIFYENNFYPIGAEIDLSDSVAKKLQDVVTLIEEETSTKPKTATKATKTTKIKTEETDSQNTDNDSSENTDDTNSDGEDA